MKYPILPVKLWANFNLDLSFFDQRKLKLNKLVLFDWRLSPFTSLGWLTTRRSTNKQTYLLKACAFSCKSSKSLMPNQNRFSCRLQVLKHSNLFFEPCHFTFKWIRQNSVRYLIESRNLISKSIYYGLEHLSLYPIDHKVPNLIFIRLCRS